MQCVRISSVNSYVKTEIRSVLEESVNKVMQFASEHGEYSGNGTSINVFTCHSTTYLVCTSVKHATGVGILPDRRLQSKTRYLYQHKVHA